MLTITNTLNAILNLLRARDIETSLHVYRTQRLVDTISRELALTCPEISKDLHRALVGVTPFHDIGKIAIADALLFKPGRLTVQEFEIMQNHAHAGGNVINDLWAAPDRSLLVQTAHDVIEHHHERWDGTGYPNGLAEEDIPLTARIVAVSDVYEALTTKRPYKDAWSHEDAISFIMEGRGKHFDPTVVEAFRKVEGVIRKIV